MTFLTFGYRDNLHFAIKLKPNLSTNRTVVHTAYILCQQCIMELFAPSMSSTIVLSLGESASETSGAPLPCFLHHGAYKQCKHGS